ncbi:MAG: hypothetical protein ACFFEA_01205 [Candidatus Thorarchaeota archaeon]
MIRIRRSDGFKILAILLSSSVLITTTIVSLPITTYDLPPQTLFEGYLEEGNFLGYYLWVDTGVWVVMEIFSEFQARIRVESWVESERVTHLLSDRTSYHGAFTLEESSQGQSVFILITPRIDTTVRLEIVDSSYTVSNNIDVLTTNSWFLLLSFTALILDGYLVSGWLKSTTRHKRKRKMRIKKNHSNDEIRIPVDYVLLSRTRNLFAKQDKSDS